MDFAPLETIHIDQLSPDRGRCSELLEAARSPGFFQLDLGQSQFQDLEADICELRGLSEEYFALDASIKKSHIRKGVERGYKPGGAESFEVLINPTTPAWFALTLRQMARDELDLPALAFPGPFRDHTALLARTIRQCDRIAQIILLNVAQGLQVGDSDVVKNASDTTRSSDTSLKLISAPTFTKREDHPDTTHTDEGLITLLWCPQVSSQIQDPRTKTWQWVDVRPGCVLVNVADALQAATNNRVHSCLHRIGQTSDGIAPRHFVSYYLRP